MTASNDNWSRLTIGALTALALVLNFVVWAFVLYAFGWLKIGG